MKLTLFVFRILLITTLALAFPVIYHLIMTPDLNRAQSFYSKIDQQFYTHISTEQGAIYLNESSDTITKSEYIAALPFLYFQNLMRQGALPDSLGGYALTPELIATSNKFFRITPRNVKSPDFLLHPLIYRNITDGILIHTFLAFDNELRIINPQTNSLNQTNTDLFQKKLNNLHFKHPAKKIFGRKNQRELIQEGIFVVDANNHFFNLYFENSVPIVKIIPLPKGAHIEYMINTNFKDHSAYGIIIDQNNTLYLLESVSYNIIKLPITNYNPIRDEIVWAGNLLSTTVNISNEDSVCSFAMDINDGTLLAKHSIKITEGNRKLLRYYKQLLMPFTLKTRIYTNREMPLSLTFSPFRYWLINSFVSLLIYCLIMYRRKEQNRTSLTLIAFTGLYGLISCLLVKD